MEPMVNIDRQPSVSLAGHRLTLQTSVHSTRTGREGKSGGLNSSCTHLREHSYVRMRQRRSAIWRRQAGTRRLYSELRGSCSGLGTVTEKVTERGRESERKKERVLEEEEEEEGVGGQ